MSILQEHRALYNLLLEQFLFSLYYREGGTMDKPTLYRRRHPIHVAHPPTVLNDKFETHSTSRNIPRCHGLEIPAPM